MSWMKYCSSKNVNVWINFPKDEYSRIIDLIHLIVCNITASYNICNPNVLLNCYLRAWNIRIQEVFLLTVHLPKRLSYSHMVDLLEYFFTFFSSDHSISFHLLCWNVLISRNTNVLFLTHPNTAGCYWWF